MKRQSEAKKAEKMKKNLHLIDFPKMNQKISFVSSYAEIKERITHQVADDDDDEEVAGPKVRLNTEAIRKEVAIQQSDNK